MTIPDPLLTTSFYILLRRRRHPWPYLITRRRSIAYLYRPVGGHHLNRPSPCRHLPAHSTPDMPLRKNNTLSIPNTLSPCLLPPQTTYVVHPLRNRVSGNCTCEVSTQFRLIAAPLIAFFCRCSNYTPIPLILSIPLLAHYRHIS